MNKKGFTLSEIIAVIILISIIVAIAVPSVLSVKKRVNERLFEGKKETILVAAELYGQDNPHLFNPDEFIVTVGELVNANYVEKDTEQNDKNCSDSYGCAINPIDNSSLNDVKILVKRNVSTVIAIWEGEQGSTTSEELVDKEENINVVKINVDEHPELAKKYGVMSIPLLLLYNNNKIEKKHVGVMEKEEIIEWIK